MTKVYQANQTIDPSVNPFLGQQLNAGEEAPKNLQVSTKKAI